ncbi:hypothetical protein ANCCAN_11653 [Ancylostoma caninum]|uniref:LUC7 protein n=1 Tax=Ancylostoma caninum TaxID=29170 RepID=A0A368GD72_ANCCA|nr:hypothetical protein ANCCAN_11653 [Ancylostoma caninum]
MTDVMRDMIAQLMGSQKEGEEGRDLPPYHHPSVCRAYLIGCCPYELVPDSRLQGLVSCRKTHEPAHKADFLKAQKERDHYYDVDAFDILENAIRIVDNEISRIKDKLDREAREQTDTAEAVKTQRINDLSEQIGKAVAEMEELGNMGKVEESMKLSKTVEDLRARKAELEGQTDFRLAGPGSNAARLRVCEDCGAQLNIMDHESRIADHFGGKMHLGMVECREKYAEMKATIEERRKERREKGLDAGPRFSERRRTPPPRRDRDRDDRDRRDRHGGGSRKRSRSRSNDRDRDRDRRRDRDRDDRRGSGRDYRDRDRRDRRY